MVRKKSVFVKLRGRKATPTIPAVTVNPNCTRFERIFPPSGKKYARLCGPVNGTTTPHAYYNIGNTTNVPPSYC